MLDVRHTREDDGGMTTVIKIPAGREDMERILAKTVEDLIASDAQVPGAKVLKDPP